MRSGEKATVMEEKEEQGFTAEEKTAHSCICTSWTPTKHCDKLFKSMTVY